MRAQYSILRGLNRQLLQADITVVGHGQRDRVLELEPKLSVHHMIAHVLWNWKRI